MNLIFHFIFTVLTKILAASGVPFGFDPSRDTSEILDLVDSTLSCQHLAPFPKEMRGPTGGLVDGVPLICGGSESSDINSVSDECYIISKLTTSLVAIMKEKRVYAASVVLNDTKLWVMGGKDSFSFSSSEYIKLSFGSTPGPELPSAVHGHAVVAWNSSFFMLIGGHTSKTFYYQESPKSY